MTIFSDKNVIAALIVAPILALLSYYLVDMMVTEPPQAAVKGQSYPLLAASNCRYTSGVCDLENADLTFSLTVLQQGGRDVLQLKSKFALQGVKVDFTDNSQIDKPSTAPENMHALADNKSWLIDMPIPPDANTTLRIVIALNGAHYYAETTMGFSKYETTFNKES